MKKIVFGIILVVVLMIIYQLFHHDIQTELNNTRLDYCIDDDTAQFILNEQSIRVRFISVDTPEMSYENPDLREEHAQEAATYTCHHLTSAQNIKLENEPSIVQDKYERYLMWVWVDGVLLQEQIVQQGYSKIDFRNKNTLHFKKLIEAQEKAIDTESGLWEK